MNAYLKSFLDNNKLPIFIKLLSDIYHLWQVRNRLLYKLLKSLYDLKESKRLRNWNVIVFYKRIRFKQLNSNTNKLIQQPNSKIRIMNIYVDNFLLISRSINVLNNLKKILLKKYDIKDLRKIEKIIN